jgi:hypothetical protein
VFMSYAVACLVNGIHPCIECGGSPDATVKRSILLPGATVVDAPTIWRTASPALATGCGPVGRFKAAIRLSHKR